MVATNGGNYTAVVSATFSGQFGDYGITLAQAPEPFVISAGQSGGPLVNGAGLPGTLGLGGLNLWSFYGTYGDSNVLSVVATNFTPWIRVYGPDGALVGETTSGSGGVRNGSVSLSITNNGIYNVVVSATFSGQFGTYAIKEVRIPPDLLVPDTPTIAELTTLSTSISAQDPSVPAKPLVFALLSGPQGMTLTAAGSTNASITWPTTEADGGTTNPVTVTVTDIVNNHNFIRTNSFNVVVLEINKPPVLSAVAPQSVNELALLTVPNPATEPDPKSTTTGYALINPPAGASIDANGTITWTPTQAQSPSTNTFTTLVTNSNPLDHVNPQLTATNSFTVVVKEVNQAPVLPVIATQTLKAYTLLTITNTATESNIHSSTAGYALLNAPAGVSISSSGVITWTPNQVPSPTTNIITTVVSNSNPFDSVSPQLTATNSFTVIVKPISPPVLQSIADQTVHFGTLLSVQASASDPDRPGATLTYSLDPGAPTNMTINATSGLISWTPSNTQVGTNTITVHATDNGVPPLSGTTSFQVTVAGRGAQIEINQVTTAGVQLTISGDVGHVYELEKSQDLQNWTAVVQETLSAASVPYVDPEPPSIAHVFYRLKLVQ
jgi:hypothetical protein